MSPIPIGFFAASAAQVGGSYDLLETSILTSNAASVTFSNLGNYASDYQHLQIRATLRDTRSGFSAAIYSMRFNGDTSASYTSHSLGGNGSSVSSGRFGETDQMLLGVIPSSNAEANNFGATVVDILDPFETTKNTTVRALTGTHTSGVREIGIYSGVYFKTNAISSITVFSQFGNLVQFSRFSLYGYRKV
jgi:hypothetical protein